LFPYKPITPRTDVSRRQPKTETVEKTEKKTNLDKVKAWFPKDLHNLLTSSFKIEFDEHERNVIIRQKSYIDDRLLWWKIKNVIIQEHNGRQLSDPQNRYPSWIIPIK